MEHCFKCKFMKKIKYYWPKMETYFDSFICIIPDKKEEENVFRAIGNKNLSGDCELFEEK